MSLQLIKASKSFGGDVIFTNINFEVKPNEKIAVIGRNGCGKTTLMKILAQEMEMDKGNLFKPRDFQVGYLSQSNIPQDNELVKDYLETIYQSLFEMEKQLEVLAEGLKSDSSAQKLDNYAKLQHRFEEAGGYTYRSEMMSVFTQFGFSEDDLQRHLQSFSGGQKTRIAFVRLLLSKPDVLLLDEPTNHLDMKTIEWLESYLKNYPKALVLVSHDRMFIDRVSKVIIEMEDGELTRYPGNYSNYLQQKALDLEKQASSYARQQKDIQRLEVLIEKFRYKKNKAKFAQSKIKYLDRLERIDPVKKDKRTFHADFHARLRGGKQVLLCQDYTVGYDHPLATINLELLRNHHTAIIGPNGHGKSTFLKTLIGKLQPLSGEVLWGHQIEIGYFDQEQVEYTSENTVLEDLWDEYPDLTQTEVRTVLGSFLFSADEVFKDVRVLSGGEKVRLALAKLMLKQANLLILDEPTNHLDIPAKEALEKALAHYEGTILFVSHDRYFIQKMAKAILNIEDGIAAYYPLSLEEVQNQAELNQVTQHSPQQNVVSARDTSKQSKSRLEKQLKKIEEAITQKEEELEAARDLRFEPDYYHDHFKMKELDEIIDGIHNEISRLMQDWESLHESIEECE